MTSPEKLRAEIEKRLNVLRKEYEEYGDTRVGFIKEKIDICQAKLSIIKLWEESLNSHTGTPRCNASNPSIATSNVGVRDKSKEMDTIIQKAKQEKDKMTAKDLLNSGVIGTLKHRDDLKDSVKYAKKLADDLFK